MRRARRGRGLHLNMALPSAGFQATVRAHIQAVYPELIDYTIEVADGCSAAPTGPGLDAKVHDSLFNDANQLRVSAL